MAGKGEAKETRKRAQGRTLTEFGTLGPAEQTLLEACRTGEFAQIANERPKKKTIANSIRPGFLRFLALGGDDIAPLHEKGVQLGCAWIDGSVDLISCEVRTFLWLLNCTIDGELILQFADTQTLDLTGTAVHGIQGSGLRCRDHLLLRNGFHSKGTVILRGAHIGGSLECSGSRFDGANGVSLDCDRIDVGGYVLLRKEGDHKFNANGQVDLRWAHIGNSLDCSGGHFDGCKGEAIYCRGTKISGGVFLRDGFHSIGEVNFMGALVEGDFICDDSTFEANSEYTLLCNGANICGAIHLRNFREPKRDKAGVISLLAVRALTLNDEPASWATASGLILDGFTYDRIAGVQRTDRPGTASGDGPLRDAVTRIAWLDRQVHRHLKNDFRPQPWRQLANVLMQMGNEDDARTILIEMRKRQRASRWKYYDDRCERRWWFLRTRLDWLIGFFVAYGYRPDRAMYWLFGLWVIGGMIYWSVAQAGIMAPTDAHFYLDQRIPSECKVDWINYTSPRLPTSDKIAKAPNDASRESLQQLISTDATRRHYEAGRVGLDATRDWTWKAICDRAVPSEYSVFQPFIYSIDIMLPFLELRQERDFAPRVLDDSGNVIEPLPNWVPLIGGTWGLGYFVRLWEWFEIFFGWTLTILIAASVSGIIKKD